MPLEERKIAFIGGGHITEIIITNLLRTKTLAPEQLVVSDPRKSRLDELGQKYRVATTTDNGEALQWGDFVFINVLPQVVGDVVSELAHLIYGKAKLSLRWLRESPCGATPLSPINFPS